MTELRTERLLLRPLRPDEAEALVAIANDWDVMRMLVQPPFPYTLKDANDYIGGVRQDQPNQWGIFLGDQLIGVIGVKDHLGYWLGRAHWGRGYATEAATAALDHFFASNESDHIISGVFVENAASRHVLQKLGFVETGRQMKYSNARKAEGLHIDLRLNREAWLARPGN